MSDVEPNSRDDYCEELMLTQSTARETALQSIYTECSVPVQEMIAKQLNTPYYVDDWVLIRFPSEETSRLWNSLDHGMAHTM